MTFGNGVPMSLRASARLAGLGVSCTVLDLRWLAPLPVDAVAEIATAFPAVLVVDETRASGGVAEGVVTGLVETGYGGRTGPGDERGQLRPAGTGRRGGPAVGGRRRQRQPCASSVAARRSAASG